jgi:hypothetical protein
MSGTFTLWRLISEAELHQIAACEMREFPEPARGLTFFYPSVDASYYERISLDLSRHLGGKAFLVRFEVRSTYLDSCTVNESGIVALKQGPPQSIRRLNDALAGPIRLVRELGLDRGARGAAGVLEDVRQFA